MCRGVEAGPEHGERGGERKGGKEDQEQGDSRMFYIDVCCLEWWPIP